VVKNIQMTVLGFELNKQQMSNSQGVKRLGAKRPWANWQRRETSSYPPITAKLRM